MNPLQTLYRLGLGLDRKLTKAKRLPHPVISVGNVNVGGRAKTPLVIDLCRMLKEKGYSPVVLTRGYGRKWKKDVWLLPETIPQLQLISTDKSGDEAVEIFLKAQVPVLVSARRAKQAFKYAQQFKNSKTVFILDDGFQHWKIERDFDFVVVSDYDFEDSLLPTGRLRENVSSLKRAHCILRLEKDLRKKIQIKNSEKISPSQVVAVTTRAGSQKPYERLLAEHLGFAVQVVALKDHCPTEDLCNTIKDLDPSVKQILLGVKEAVKLLTPQQIMSATTTPFPFDVKGRPFEVFLVDLDLEFDRLKVYDLLKEKVLLK